MTERPRSYRLTDLTAVYRVGDTSWRPTWRRRHGSPRLIAMGDRLAIIEGRVVMLLPAGASIGPPMLRLHAGHGASRRTSEGAGDA